MFSKTIHSAVLLVAAASIAFGDGRDSDRAAIRAHIDRVFQAFIHKDAAELRATHAQNRLGYLEGSTRAIHGRRVINATGAFNTASPYGMNSYRMREFDMIFQGDAAFVAFVADVDSNTPTGVQNRALRITDLQKATRRVDPDGLRHAASSRFHRPAVPDFGTLSDLEPKPLLDARESAWRACFACDRATLEKLLPEELLTMEPSGGAWCLATNDSVVRLSASSWKMEPGMNPQLYALRDVRPTANRRLRQISADHTC